MTMKKYLSLIKFSHTIFAMPFACVGFGLGVTDQWGSFQDVDLSDWIWKGLGVVACMVFARSAAMAFNRYLDRNIDAMNPRTSMREIPAGLISPKRALSFDFRDWTFSFRHRSLLGCNRFIQLDAHHFFSCSADLGVRF
jgi:4-hydroxybenzoate polyprenyltransferase